MLSRYSGSHHTARSSLPDFEADFYASLNEELTGHISDLITDSGCRSAMSEIHNIYESIAS
jgi:hypothetical protein